MDNERHRQKRRASQDLVNSKYFESMQNGPVDLSRRLEASASLKRHCEIYNPDKFFLGWSPYHLEAVDKLEKAILDRQHFAMTMPRGSGKTTLCQAAIEWAHLHGHSPYSMFIPKTAADAGRRRDAIKVNLRFNQLLMEDFPEICGPIRFTEGEARKAAGQRFNGETTGIQWGSEHLIFADLLNFAELAPWYSDVKPTLGSIIDFASIDGSIRGRSFETKHGTIERPWVAVVDDPQTRESAASPAQVEKRVRTLKGDIAYLGGPGRRCGVVVPCTVVYEDDLADQLMDHEKNPEYRGMRSSMLTTMPGEGCPDEEAAEIMQLWEQDYDELRKYDRLNDTNQSTEFYLKNQEKMDKGAEASWPERYDDNQASAIQHAMDLYLEDAESFFAEAQNKPAPLISHDQIPLKPEDIHSRVVGVSRGTIPNDHDKVVAFIDVSRNVLWWVIVSGSQEHFGPHIVDSGVFPEQTKKYVTLATASRTIPKVYGDQEYSSALLQAMDDLVEHLDNLPLRTEAGMEMKLDAIGIDSGWGAETNTVYTFCQRHRLSSKLVATKGFGITPLRRPLVDPTKKRISHSSLEGQWKFVKNSVGSKLLEFDTNLWKSRTNSMLRTAKESKFALTIHHVKRPAFDLRSVSEQLTAEKPAWLEGSNGSRVEIWQNPGNQDNHYLDCVVGASVLLHSLGCQLPNATKEVLAKASMARKVSKRRKRKTKVNA